MSSTTFRGLTSPARKTSNDAPLTLPTRSATSPQTASAVRADGRRPLANRGNCGEQKGLAMAVRPQRQGQIIPGERVGKFHFAATGPREYRLVARLRSGARITLHSGKSIGDLWRQPWLVSPELESEVLDLRVEQRPDTAVKGDWKPLLAD